MNTLACARTHAIFWQMALSEHAVSYGFEDSGTEERYMEEEAGILKYRLTAGAAMHFVGTLFQYALMLDPPHALRFAEGGLGPSLEAAHTQARVLLLQNLRVQAALSIAIISFLWWPHETLGDESEHALRGARRARVTELLAIVLGGMRVAWLLVSIRACEAWPMHQYVTGFAATYSLSQFIIVSLPSRHYTFFFVVSHMIYWGMARQSADIITGIEGV